MRLKKDWVAMALDQKVQGSALRIFLLVSFAFVAYGFAFDSSIWRKNLVAGVYELDAQTVTFHPQKESTLYLGTSKAVYHSADQGKTSQVILRPSGDQDMVHDIYVPRNQPSLIYSATDAGLYVSLNEGASWERMYYAGQGAASQCFSVVLRDDTVFLGTGDGLWTKGMTQASWRQMKEGFDHDPVVEIKEDEAYLYAIAGDGVFRFDEKLKDIRKVFSLGVRAAHLAEDAVSAVPVSREDDSIRALEVFPGGLLLASTQGVYVSSDYGETWARLPSANLPLRELTSLLVLERDPSSHGEGPALAGGRSLLAGTKKGVFSLNQGMWTPIYRGMETVSVNRLVKDPRGTVYAATDKGVFQLADGEMPPSFWEGQSPLGPGNFKNIDEDALFAGEPDIREVQGMVVGYADVSREKIESWKRQARLRGWFPSLSVGMDRGRDWSRSDSVWGSYTGGGQYFIGPEDSTRGKDSGWDVSLSWDLADVVWTSDQTTIDSRSKLMVELREDLLNEVTRLYFERRRARMELAAYAGSMDPQIRLERELRVSELTALIDALTGGKFSQRVVASDK